MGNRNLPSENSPLHPWRGAGGEVSFRPLAMGDLAIMREWLHRPHVARWWPGWPSAEQVAAKYGPVIAGSEPTRGYLIQVNAAAAGYIQCYLIRDWPDYAGCVAVAENAAGVDLFIGEPEFLHRGIGPVILRAFLREVVFPATGADSCIIGPAINNHAAIRAYEKTGFKHLKTIEVAGELQPEYLMRIGRGGLLAESRAQDGAP